MEKVKLIQGNEERAEEIRKTIEEWGGANEYGFSFGFKNTYYYVDQFGLCRCIKEDVAKEYVGKGKAEIYELPPLQPKFKFRPFGMVLVRDSYNEYWEVDLFLRYDKDEEDYQYRCLRGSWNQCIKYKGNEALLGTTDNPK